MSPLFRGIQWCSLSTSSIGTTDSQTKTLTYSKKWIFSQHTSSMAASWSRDLTSRRTMCRGEVSQLPDICKNNNIESIKCNEYLWSITVIWYGYSTLENVFVSSAEADRGSIQTFVISFSFRPWTFLFAQVWLSPVISATYTWGKINFVARSFQEFINFGEKLHETWQTWLTSKPLVLAALQNWSKYFTLSLMASIIIKGKKPSSSVFLKVLSMLLRYVSSISGSYSYSRTWQTEAGGHLLRE